MIEVLWHGRGGQGAFTAARLLGAASSMDDGAFALAFPSFGPERRGAPMRAFTKIAAAPIGDRSAITRADYVIYLDDTLLAPGWESELKPGGLVLVNSAKPVADLLRGIVAQAPSAAVADGPAAGDDVVAPAAAGAIAGGFAGFTAGGEAAPAADGPATASACRTADSSTSPAAGGLGAAADRVLAIDANGISSALLGRPIPNTVFLGALSLLCDQVPFDAVNEAVRQYMPAKLHEKNLAIVAEARHAMAQALVDRAVARQAQEACAAGGVDGESCPGQQATARAVSRETPSGSDKWDAAASKEVAPGPSPTLSSAADGPREAAVNASATLDGAACEGARPAPLGMRASAGPAASENLASARPAASGTRASARPAAPLRPEGVLIPRLREQMAAAPGGVPIPSLEPRDFAQSTCYRAGHLVTRNAGWRNLRPVLTPSLCTGCLQCYLYCPDGAVVRTRATKDQLSAGDSPAAAVALDYDFCKGCGICVRACRFDALTMIPEEEALAARQTAVGEQTADGEELAAAFLSDYEHEGGAR